MDLKLASAPGRYFLTLSDRWVLVALAPVPGVIVLGLFLDGELVELVEDPLDVLGHLRASATFQRSPRSSAVVPRRVSLTRRTCHEAQRREVAPASAVVLEADL